MRVPTLTPLFSSSGLISYVVASLHLDHSVFNLTMIDSKTTRGLLDWYTIPPSLFRPPLSSCQ